MGKLKLNDEYDKIRHRSQRKCSAVARVLALSLLVFAALVISIVYHGIVLERMERLRQIVTLNAKHEALLGGNRLPVDAAAPTIVLLADATGDAPVDGTAVAHMPDDAGLRLQHARLMLHQHQHHQHQHRRRWPRSLMSANANSDLDPAVYALNFSELYAKVRSKRQKIALSKLEKEYVRCKKDSIRGKDCMVAFVKMYNIAKEISAKMEKMKEIFKDSESVLKHHEHSSVDDESGDSKESSRESSANSANTNTNTSSMGNLQKMKAVKISWIIDGHDGHDTDTFGVQPQEHAAPPALPDTMSVAVTTTTTTTTTRTPLIVTTASADVATTITTTTTTFKNDTNETTATTTSVELPNTTTTNTNVVETATATTTTTTPPIIEETTLHTATEPADNEDNNNNNNNDPLVIATTAMSTLKAAVTTYMPPKSPTDDNDMTTTATTQANTDDSDTGDDTKLRKLKFDWIIDGDDDDENNGKKLVTNVTTDKTTTTTTTNTLPLSTTSSTAAPPKATYPTKPKPAHIDWIIDEDASSDELHTNGRHSANSTEAPCNAASGLCQLLQQLTANESGHHPLDYPSSLENMLESFELHEGLKPIIQEVAPTTTTTTTTTLATPTNAALWAKNYEAGGQQELLDTFGDLDDGDTKRMMGMQMKFNPANTQGLGVADSQFMSLCERMAKRVHNRGQAVGASNAELPSPANTNTESPNVQFTSRGPGGFPVTSETMKATAQFMFNQNFGLPPMIPICFYVTPANFRMYSPGAMWGPQFFGGYGGPSGALMGNGGGGGGGGGGAAVGGGPGGGGVFFVPPNFGATGNFFGHSSGSGGGGSQSNIPNIFSKNATPQKQQQQQQQQQFYCTYMQKPAGATGGGGSGTSAIPLNGVNSIGFSNANFKMRHSNQSADIIYASYAGLPNHLGHAEHFKCPTPDQLACYGGNQCVRAANWCDGTVQCADGSDEAACTCRDRLSGERVCDGYADCPMGEDETGCFGCEDFMHSCYDNAAEYERFNRSTVSMCYSRLEKCDGFKNCLNGRDELECNRIVGDVMHHMSHAVSASEGFLYHNHRGEWYPVCNNAEHWSHEACANEGAAGQPPNVTFKAVKLAGPFVEPSLIGSVHFPQSCQKRDANDALIDQVAYVRCAAAKCGLAKRKATPEVAGGKRARSTPTITDTDNEEVGLAPTDERIVGGSLSEPLAWPFVVAIYRNGNFHCGGTIYAQHWIISAAHCVVNYHKYHYEVRAGVLRRSSYSVATQIQPVSHVIVHQRYERHTMRNDLALLRLAEPLHFNRWVKPICLPGPGRTGPADDNWFDGPAEGTQCTAVGWGAIREKGAGSDQLREVTVPVRRFCTEREDKESHNICAGDPNGGRDACQGDSGGPLFCRSAADSNEWYLAGVVSHGNGCARPGEFGVYTRVALFLDWMASAMRADAPLPVQQPLPLCPGYMCVWGGKRCIPQRKRCDRFVDCLGGEDEVGCTYTFDPDVGSAKNASTARNVATTTDAGVLITDGDVVTEETQTEKTSTVASTVADVASTVTDVASTVADVASTVADVASTVTDVASTVADVASTVADVASTVADVVSTVADVASTVADVASTVTDVASTATTTVASTAATTVGVQELNTTPTTLDIETTTLAATTTTTVATSTPTTTLNDQPPELPLSTQKPFDVENLITTTTTQSSILIESSSGSSTLKTTTTTTESTTSSSIEMKTAPPTTTTTTTTPTTVKSKTTTAAAQLPQKFVCQKIPQIIELTHRCDRRIDCEDGTDEANCSCRDYLKGRLSALVCDGKADCEDLSDERDCSKCKSDEFHCPQSNDCVALQRRCDTVIDCMYAEDEQDCYALTNGKTIELDPNRRPVLSNAGIFTRNMHGTWRIVCSHESPLHEHGGGTAAEICALLGFRGVLYHNTTTVEHVVHDSVVPIVPELAGRQRQSPLPLRLFNRDASSAESHRAVSVAGRIVDAALRVVASSSASSDAAPCLGLFVECEAKSNQVQPLKTFSAGSEVTVPPAHSLEMHTLRPTLETHSLPNVYVKPHSELMVVQRKHEILSKLSGAAKTTTMTPSGRPNSTVLVHNKLHEAVEELHWPWLVDIYANGRLWCVGVLVDKHWVLVHASCHYGLRLGSDYVTALLGGGKTRHVHHQSPHEQIRHIDCSEVVPGSDVQLYHLARPARFTHHILPTFLPADGAAPPHQCLAVLHDDKYGRIKTVAVAEHNDSPVCRADAKQALACYRLEERQPPVQLLQDSALSAEELANMSEEIEVAAVANDTRPLTRFTTCKQFGQRRAPAAQPIQPLDQGVLVCRSNNTGWYPAAMFSYNNTDCASFRTAFAVRTLRHVYGHIQGIIDQPKCSFEEKPPECRTFRCPLGDCLRADQVCDGRNHCHDGSDEDVVRCHRSRTTCRPDEFKCRSSDKCVPKSKFCDHIQDCDDLTDEPTICSCFTYLQASDPGKICDGIRNCWDKSDESPAFCNCTADHFQCTSGDDCIPRDFVCDKERDCPDGEDEQFCYGVEHPISTLNGTQHSASWKSQHKNIYRPFMYGQVIEQSYGVWHTKCFPRAMPPDLSEVRRICKKLGYSPYRQPSYRLIDARSNEVVESNEMPHMRGRSFGDEPIAGKYREATKALVASKFSPIHLNDDLVLFMKPSRPLAQLVRWNATDASNCYRMEIKCA